MIEIRRADLQRDLGVIRELWLEYFTSVDTELEKRYGFATSTTEDLEHDMATIGRFEPPDGELLVASVDGLVIGTVAMLRIGSDVVELKRKYVRQSHRQAGAGRALVDELIQVIRRAGNTNVRLDSPDFLTPAHRLYRSLGFVEIGPYAESEIPSEWFSRWLFMELRLGPELP
jgi:GNAT superfamily N-acetyltransferase